MVISIDCLYFVISLNLCHICAMDYSSDIHNSCSQNRRDNRDDYGKANERSDICFQKYEANLKSIGLSHKRHRSIDKPRTLITLVIFQNRYLQDLTRFEPLFYNLPITHKNAVEIDDFQVLSRIFVNKIKFFKNNSRFIVD